MLWSHDHVIPIAQQLYSIGNFAVIGIVCTHSYNNIMSIQ
jgi:hypothetical protein